MTPDGKALHAAPTFRRRFDRIFALRTGYEALDKLLERLPRRKNELLKVLDHPEIPLHTNASENDLRSFVTKRKISGGTMSRDGRVARDIMLGLMKTCQKLGLSFYYDLGDPSLGSATSANRCRPVGDHSRSGLITRGRFGPVAQPRCPINRHRHAPRSRREIFRFAIY
nr:transposase [Rhizobium leguminosarum]